MRKNKKAGKYRQETKNVFVLRNKKAWIRIVESFMAAMILAIFLLTFYSSQAKKSNEEIPTLGDRIIEEIIQNNNFRNDVFANNLVNINNFVKERISSDLNFSVKICLINDICNPDVFIPEVYAKERIISSNLHIYEPRKIKLFIWKK